MKFDVASVLGRQKAEAMAMISAAHLRCRIVKEEGHAYVPPCDYDPNRVRLEIEAGVVTRALRG